MFSFHPLDKNGYQLLPHFISIDTLKVLQENSLPFEGKTSKNVFQSCASTQAIFQQIETSLNQKGLPCSITNYCFYLSKSTTQNWPLQFHQDTNLPNYLNLNFEQQEYWLKHSFWVRVNLDANDQDTGALKVIPKSHLKGKHHAFDKTKAIFIEAEAQDIVLFSPLLYHGSNRMKRVATRRVFQCFFLQDEV